MSNFFLNYLDSVGRKRVILDRESKDPYLERYYLFLKERVSFPFNIFLHRFLRSDPDNLHDHPWPYFTLILKGGYWEWIPILSGFHPDAALTGKPVIVGEKKVWRGPGHFRVCKAESYHRIELEPGIDCWTLFMPGPQKREWGFLLHDDWDPKTQIWIPHEQYIDNKNAMKG
jgi:hypothetical protein